MEVYTRRTTRSALAEIDENGGKEGRVLKRGALGDNAQKGGIVKPRGLTVRPQKPLNVLNEQEGPEVKRRAVAVDIAGKVKRPTNGPTSNECDLLTEDYVKDIKEYSFSIEEQYTVDEDFISDKAVTTKMRSILVDWLVQVHSRFHLLAETLHLTVYLVDKFLDKYNVDKNELQLVGISAMFAASKYEETYVPDIKDFEFITDNAFTKKNLIRMEMRVLHAVEFDLGRIHSINFLRSFSTKVDADHSTHHLAKFFTELTLLDASFSCVRPSLVAGGAFWLAVQLRQCRTSVAKLFSSIPVKNAAEEMKEMGARVAACVVRIRVLGKLKAISDKYSSSKMHHASSLSEGDIEVLERIMRNCDQ